MNKTVVSIKRSHYSCEGRIEKFVMPNGDPRDGYFYPTLTLTINSYSKTDKHDNDPQTKHRLGTVSKKLLEGLNMFDGTNLTLIFDVDKDKYMFGLHERSLTDRCIIS